MAASSPWARRARRAFLWLVLIALICVPFALWADDVERTTAAILDAAAGSWLTALAVVALLASDIALPIPSSLIGTAAGAALGPVAGAAAVWAGLTLGCALGYAVGRGAAAGARRAVGIARSESESESISESMSMSMSISMSGPMSMSMSGSASERGQRAPQRWDAIALVLSRPVPVLAEAMVIAAGATGVPLARFLAITALANLGVAAVYAVLGARAADAGSLVWALAGAIAIPAVAWLVSWRVRSMETPAEVSHDR